MPDMADKGKRVSLSERQQLALYNQYCMGEKVQDLADAYKIGTSTAYHYIGEMRRREGKLASKEKVIAGNKMSGRLIAIDAGKHKFRGEHKMPDGKMRHWDFTAINSKTAIRQWEQWCEEQDEELTAFMDMCERKQPKDKPDNDTEVQKSQPITSDEAEESREEVDVTPSPVPDINVIRKENAEIDSEAYISDLRQRLGERNKKINDLEDRNAEIEEKVEELRDRLASYEGGDWVSADLARNIIAERDALKTRVAQVEQTLADSSKWLVDENHPKPSFLIWAKTDTPKVYGMYHLEDVALAEVDRLNDVAAFFGRDGAFQIEEVEWKG